jgi:hypothetical protein
MQRLFWILAKQKPSTPGRIRCGGFERTFVPIPERTESPPDGGLALLERNIPGKQKKQVLTCLSLVVYTRNCSRRGDRYSRLRTLNTGRGKDQAQRLPKPAGEVLDGSVVGIWRGSRTTPTIPRADGDTQDCTEGD